jgi:hypothetical protein
MEYWISVCHILEFFFSGAGVWIQGFTFARQATPPALPTTIFRNVNPRLSEP